jgi:hypothetical protein
VRDKAADTLQERALRGALRTDAQKLEKDALSQFSSI